MLHFSSCVCRSGVRRASPGSLTAALILLPVLAVLQYRWIGQVSDAERERHERPLRHSTVALTEDLDIELIRAFIGLRVDGPAVQSGNWTEYADRVAGWHAATAAPEIVRDVLLIDNGPSGSGFANGRSIRSSSWRRHGPTISCRIENAPETISRIGMTGPPRTRRGRWIR